MQFPKRLNAGIEKLEEELNYLFTVFDLNSNDPFPIIELYISVNIKILKNGGFNYFDITKKPASDNSLVKGLKIEVYICPLLEKTPVNTIYIELEEVP